jgi:hypothetical protein
LRWIDFRGREASAEVQSTSQGWPGSTTMSAASAWQGGPWPAASWISFSAEAPAIPDE